MVPTRMILSVSLSFLLSPWSAVAGPTSHAMETDESGAVLFVDLERGRLLRFQDGQLSLLSDLEGVPDGDLMQNLVLSITGELYLGQKKSVWKISPDGAIESATPPKEIKALFSNRPGDLAPDGSVYVSRDFKNIQRSLPGGDAHPVLASDVISRIHSMSVTPYGRVFFANNTEIAKLDAKGEVAMLQDFYGEKVFGLAAVGENAVLVLRQPEGEGLRLERLDIFGSTQTVVSPEQMAAVAKDQPVQIVIAD